MSGPTLASLGIKIDNTDVPKATASLDAMTVAGTKAEASAQRLTRRMALAEIEARNMDAAMQKNSRSILSVGNAFVEAAKGIAAMALLHEFVKNTVEAENAIAQLEAAVQSTGGAAGRSVDQLDAFSNHMQQITTYSDEAIKGVQSLLLTFDKIRGDTFDAATVAVADLATRMGGDLQGAAVQVGKALQDPITGLTALRRVGVSFSDEQKNVIANLYETNHVAEAQALILQELQKEFGGSAAAARNTLGGALAYLKNQFGEVFEASKQSSSGIIDAVNGLGDLMPLLRSGLNATLRETARMFIDLSYWWDRFINALTFAAPEAKDALEEWHKWQLKLLDGEQAHVAQIGKVKKATGEQTKEQIDNIKKVHAANEDMVRQAEQAADLATMEGTAQARVKVIYDAVNKAIEARRTLTGGLLDETLAAIEAEEKWKLAAIDNAEALKAGNAAIEEAKKAIKSFEDDLSSKLSDSLSKVFGKDNPLRGMFEVLTQQLLQVWEHNFLDPLIASLTGIQQNIDDIADASKSLEPSRTSSLFTAGAVGIGLGAAIGSATGSHTLGALGGAASGALAGAQIAGPLGALVGGLAGLAGGLFGASSAAKEASKHMDELRLSLNRSIDDIKAQLGNDALGSKIAQLHAQFDALRKQTEDAFAGGGADSDTVKQRNAKLAELNALEAQRVQQLKDEAALVLLRLKEDVDVQILRNNGHVDEADALARQHDQERRFAELRKQGIDDATIAALALSEAAKQASDDATKAAAEATRQRDLSDTATLRLMAATNDPAYETTRRALEERNEIEALVAAKASDATIEMTKQAQAAEDLAKATADAAAAQQKQIESQRAMEDLNVELLRAQGNGAGADDLSFQLAQQRRLEDAMKNNSPEYVALLQQVQQAQRDSRAAQQLIDSTGGGSGGRSLGEGASSAYASVSATVTERTALRMVDLDVARNTTLDKIEINTRGGSGGGVSNVYHLNFRVAGDLTPSERTTFVRGILDELQEQSGNMFHADQKFSGSVAG